MDKGHPRQASVTNLVVRVLDVNDNPPEFDSKFYFSTVSESVQKGSDIVRLRAVSLDEGINAQVTYAVIGGNEHGKFRIHPKTGVISVADKLDYESSDSYFLTVQATDGGDPPLSNAATVNITVTDENDNEPMFSQLSYNALINEAASVGQRVAVVTATDADAGDNAVVSYHIAHGDRQNQFRIDGVSGAITVAKDLDREMVSSYVLEVVATDGGSPVAKSSSVLVHVDISDANDNRPAFPENNYTVYVQEDKGLDTILLRFSVSDADDDPNAGPFTFDIRAGNEDNAFRVVQDGTLRTATTKFNHKIVPEYHLQVSTHSQGHSFWDRISFLGQWIRCSDIQNFSSLCLELSKL